MEVIIIPANTDNYSYFLIDGIEAAVVDASNADSVLELIDIHKVSLKYVLSTHYHDDHTSGNSTLQTRTGCKVIGGDSRISALTDLVNDYETISLGSSQINVLATPGHTKNQVAFYCAKEKMVFTGDTLFGAGCGRLLECDSERMFSSVNRLRSLPDNTKMYFGHEYTLDNCNYALTIEPDNADLIQRKSDTEKLLNDGLFSTPSTVKIEKMTNPFFRTNSEAIREMLNMQHHSSNQVFAELRRRKDLF
jgi:hydroxyacylglutathione hydrolase